MNYAALLLALALSACSGTTDDTGSADTTSEAADPAAACTDLCTTSGFSSGTADVYEHEVNCTCDGGSGTIAAEDCTATCTDLGWSAGEAYAANACQCS